MQRAFWVIRSFNGIFACFMKRNRIFEA